MKAKVRVSGRVLRDVGDAKRLAECIYGMAERGYRVHLKYVYLDNLPPLSLLRTLPLSRLLFPISLKRKAIYLEIELEKS